MLKQLFIYAWRFIVRPARAGEEIAQDPKALFYGFWIMVLSLSAAHRLAWRKALVLVLISLIPAAGIFAVFIR